MNITKVERREDFTLANACKGAIRKLLKRTIQITAIALVSFALYHLFSYEFCNLNNPDMRAFKICLLIITFVSPTYMTVYQRKYFFPKVDHARHKTLKDDVIQALELTIRTTLVALVTFTLSYLIPYDFNYLPNSDPDRFNKILNIGFIVMMMDTLMGDGLYRRLRMSFLSQVNVPPNQKKEEITIKVQEKPIAQKQWFEEETNNWEQKYFSSLYKAEKSSIHMRQHFNQYCKEDNQLKAGTYPITPGSPWESFAKEMQIKLNK